MYDKSVDDQPSTSGATNVIDNTCNVAANVCNPVFCRDGVSATLEMLYNNADVKTHHQAVFVLIHALMLESGFSLKVGHSLIITTMHSTIHIKVSVCVTLIVTISCLCHPNYHHHCYPHYHHHSHCHPHYHHCHHHHYHFTLIIPSLSLSPSLSPLPVHHHYKNSIIIHHHPY